MAYSHAGSINPLLLKDQDGKAKPSCYNLPQEGFTYGKRVESNPQPINQITNGWDIGAQNELSGSTGRKDFIKSNKLTVKYGIHTAKDQTPFRTSNHLEIKKKYGSKNIPIMLPEQDHVYGEANRPSTPVKLVIGNCFGLIEQDKNRTLYQMKSMDRSSKLTTSAKTNNYDLRKNTTNKLLEFYNKPNKDQTFKMSRFMGTSAPKVNTNLQAFGLSSIKPL